MTPRVSVIIPTYNRAPLVRLAAESVLYQTFKDFELLIVDDGSSDDTAEQLQGLDDRLHYIPQPNRGRSNARNHALSLAKGEFIAFLDSDDLYVPEKLERQVALMDARSDVSFMYTSAFNIDAEGEHYDFNYEASAEGDIYDRVAFFVPVTICLPTVMVRREVLDTVGGFDEQMNRFEDTDMWRRISKRYTAHAMREPLVKVRYHEGNQMEDPSIILDALDYYVTKALAEDADLGVKKLRRLAANLYMHYGYAVRRHEVWSGQHHPFFERAFSYSPTPKVFEVWFANKAPRTHRVVEQSARLVVRAARKARRALR